MDACCRGKGTLSSSCGMSRGTAAPMRCYPNTAATPQCHKRKAVGPFAPPPLHLSQHFVKITEHFWVITLLLPFNTHITPGGSLQPSDGRWHGNDPPWGEEMGEIRSWAARGAAAPEGAAGAGPPRFAAHPSHGALCWGQMPTWNCLCSSHSGLFL